MNVSTTIREDNFSVELLFEISEEELSRKDEFTADRRRLARLAFSEPIKRRSSVIVSSSLGIEAATIRLSLRLWRAAVMKRHVKLSLQGRRTIPDNTYKPLRTCFRLRSLIPPGERELECPRYFVPRDAIRSFVRFHNRARSCDILRETRNGQR